MILVTGGTGAVGNHLVEMLLANKQEVRIIVRGHGDWMQSHMAEFRKTGVDVVKADMRDPERLADAASGCQAIINLAGTMRSTPDESVESVNTDAVVSLVAIAEAQGIQRFIHVSCLGAIQHSGCRYFTSKWAAEQIVKRANLYWTMFRPSLIFGQDSHLMEILNFWVRALPAIPVVGSGLNRIQPISAEDVADCVLQSIYNKDTVHKTYDLVGPKSYSLAELLKLTAHWQEHAKPTFPVPSPIGYRLAELLSKFNPQSPINEDVMRIMTTDLAGDPALMQSTFKVPMLSFGPKSKNISSKR